MSVQRQALIVVGLPTHQTSLDLDQAEELDLRIVQPYYDAPWSASLVGLVVVETEGYRPIYPMVFMSDIETLKYKFKHLTGLDANVYLTTQAW